MIEVWKAIPGFEGFYEVSDHGRVRSLDRWLHAEGAVRGYPRRWKGRVLAPQKHSAGYAQVQVGGIACLVHALVLGAFVGPAPEGQEARHLNGQRLDNRLANLCWGTHAENVEDRRRHGTDGCGEKNAMAKLDAAGVLEIRQRVARGESYVSVAADFPVTERAIGKIARRERWTHV